MDSTILDQVISYMYELVPKKVNHARIVKDCFRNDTTVPLSAILVHIVKDGYVDRWPYSDNGSTNIEKDHFSLSITGIRKHQLAIFKNLGLYQSEEIDKSAQKKMDDQIKQNQLVNSTSERWVKKYWWIMLVIGWVGGMATDMGKEYLKRRLFPDEKKDQTPSVKSDSLSAIRDTVKRAINHSSQ